MALLLLLAMPMVVNIGIILNFRRMLTNRKAISFLFYELLVAAAVVVDTVIGEITLAHVVVAFCLIQIYITVQIEYEKQQEEQLLQQRISIMISQIQPHFLYNVLTSIRALCRIDAREAESALTDFTLYLRGNLDSLSNTGCIPFCRNYSIPNTMLIWKNALWPGSDRPFQHAGHAILPATAHIGADRRKRGAPRRDAAASGRDGDHLYKRDRVGFRRDCFG